MELPLYVACLTTALSKELEGGPCVTAGEELSVACPRGPIAASRSFSRTSGLRPLPAACPAAALSQDRQAAPLPTRRRRLSAACQAVAPIAGRYRPTDRAVHSAVRGLPGRGPITLATRGIHQSVMPEKILLVLAKSDTITTPYRTRSSRTLSAVCLAAAPSQGYGVENPARAQRPVRGLPGCGPIVGSQSRPPWCGDAVCPRPDRPRPHRRHQSSPVVSVSNPPSVACSAAAPSQVRQSCGLPKLGSPILGLSGRGPIAGGSLRRART